MKYKLINIKTGIVIAYATLEFNLDNVTSFEFEGKRWYVRKVKDKTIFVDETEPITSLEECLSSLSEQLRHIILGHEEELNIIATEISLPILEAQKNISDSLDHLTGALNDRSSSNV